MLYLLRNLRTSLSFAPSEIDKIGEVKTIWSKLRQKIEGKFTNELGLIVHVTNPELEGKEKMSLARLDNHGGCTLDVQFSAISFKVSKNDLVYCRITQISAECISGKTSFMEVKIPRSKIDPQLEHEKSLHCFRLKNRGYKVEIGDYLICRCFQSRIEMGSSIHVIAELPSCLISLNIDRL